MRLDIAAQTDIGRRKQKNEDYYGIFREDTPDLRLFKEGALLVVADGLGGHTGGEIASKLSVSILKDSLTQEPPPPPEDPEEDQGPIPVICDGIKRANENLFRTNQELIKTGRPMGTTLLATLIAPRKVYVANVGDSRCYHFRDGEVVSKTEDHSWVDEQVKLGLMSKAEAENDVRRNVVTRCIGTQPEVEIDTYIWHVVPGDILLLCTDGLINMVKETDLVSEFRKRATPAEIAQRLIQAANENGGKDNITVLVAEISPSPVRLVYNRLRSFMRRHGKTMAWLLFALAVGLGGFAAGYMARGGGK
jgi:serine/threonine protein phosphatase PrpC